MKRCWGGGRCGFEGEEVAGPVTEECGVEAEKGGCSVCAAVDDGSVYLAQYRLLEFCAVLVQVF